MSFDPHEATRQLFIDSILGAFARSADNVAYGYGWHFVALTKTKDAALITFETPVALVGWDGTTGGGDITGPHQVIVTITSPPAQPQEAPAPPAGRQYLKPGDAQPCDCPPNAPFTNGLHLTMPGEIWHKRQAPPIAES